MDNHDIEDLAKIIVDFLLSDQETLILIIELENDRLLNIIYKS